MSSQFEQKLAAFSSLIEIAATINASLEPDDVLPNIMTMAQRVMNAAAASVAVVDDATRELVYIVATGQHGQKVREGLRLPINAHSIAGWVAETSQPLVLTDVYNDPRFNRAAAEKIGLIPRSMVCVPLKVRDKIIGILQAIDPLGKQVFDQNDGEFFQAFGNLAATAIQNARLHKAALKQQSERQEREIARQIQISFLPKRMPKIAGLTAHGCCEAARDLAGDFFDVLQLSPTKVGLLVGDVTGKGLASSLHMVRCLFGARRYATVGTAPGEMLSEINHTLAEESTENLAAEMAAGTPRPPIFLAMLYATFDSSTGELRYANAGLPDPVLCSGGKCGVLSDSGGPALGMVDGMTFAEGVIQVQPGDTVLLFSDGLSEARNLGGVEFGYERIGEVLAAPHTNAEAAVRLLTDSVHHFIGSAERHDDLTFLALHYNQREAPATQITVKSHPRHLSEVRQFVRDVLGRTKLDEQTGFNVVLAVDEACANIIRHAYKNDHSQDIIVKAEIHPDALEFRLRDFGDKGDPATFKSRELEKIRPGGLGCFFMTQVFDKVEYNIDFPQGTELRLVKSIDAATPRGC